MKGKITKIVKDRKFFFVDEYYWCHFNDYNNEPEEGDIVEYERKVSSDGKKNAINIRFIKKGTTLPSDYENEINQGYFDSEGCLKENMIIQFPQMLARLFTIDQKINKPTQVRKYYDHCKYLEGIFKTRKDFNHIKPELLQLIPLTNNAVSKGHISNSFRDFIEININQAVFSEKNFIDGFLPHFQSLIGYYNN